MNTFRGPITADGALVDVLLGLGAADIHTLRQRGQPIPQPVQARAVLDTAAEITCVDPAILTPVVAGVATPIQFVFANVPAVGTAHIPQPTYAVGLTILHPSGHANLVLRSQKILEQPLAVLGYHILIGRDILSHCLFIYDGPGGIFTLGY